MRVVWFSLGILAGVVAWEVAWEAANYAKKRRK
jgi:hypothetical protein